MAENPIARIKELDKEKEQLIAAARKEALSRAQEAIAELNGLGFSYQLTEGSASARRGRTATRSLKAAPCPVCKFMTSPPHDARKHRGQGARKKPFTAAELQERGLKKA